MIVLLSLIYLFGGSTSTFALPALRTSRDILGRDASVGVALDQLACICTDQRTIWDIIWGCLTTLFACTWVSVHPSMPAPGEKWWRVALHRIELMVWMLVMPEVVICWALRQWVGARLIAKEQMESGWTTTHGHFVQMGGFMLCDKENNKVATLSYTKYKELLTQKIVVAPIITREEIEDRSKSDGLAKLIVLVQTGWFILQFIVRAVKGLEPTGLEVATLAFAALNGCLYFFWWNKPFDVRVPVSLYLLDLDQGDSSSEESESANPANPDVVKNQALQIKEIACPASSETIDTDGAQTAVIPLEKEAHQADSKDIPLPQLTETPQAPHFGVQKFERSRFQNIHSQNISSENVVQGPLTEWQTLVKKFPPHTGLLNIDTPSKRSENGGNINPDVPAGFHDLSLWEKIRISPVILSWSIMGRLYELIGETRAGQKVVVITYNAELPPPPPEFGPIRAPRFDAHVTVTMGPYGYFGLIILIASAFGAVHCLGWLVVFHTSSEQWIWRVSSVYIATMPLGLTGFLMIFHDSAKAFKWNESIVGFITTISISSTTILYIVARVFLLILTVTTLRNLPPGVYDVVDWTIALPHI